ncbi:MAG: sigma-70 family RNA polymerase sigma factor [Planctomycetes bacterium]|nr:sigma-70 family RNA polymerase sigma factor [Planctomycetota bacterium]
MNRQQRDQVVTLAQAISSRWERRLAAGPGEYLGVAWLAGMRAAGRFDPGRGVTFALFIGQAIYMAVRQQSRVGRHVSLDAMLQDDNGHVHTLPDDRVAPPDRHAEVLDELGKALSGLTDRQRAVLDMAYARGLTAKQIAERMSVTPRRVSQIRQAAMKKAREEIVCG